MYGTNLNAEPNFHLQAFNQYGIKYVTGPYTSYNLDVFRAFTATTDCVITATAVVGDSLTNEIIYAGTTVYGLFISIVVTSGNAVLHLAEPSVISELVNSYYNTAAQYGYYSEAQKCTSERLNPYLAGGLYDKASWLLIPSQVEEDFVRTFKPADNSGSLSFTRASDATRTNAAGEIERTPWNLVTFSEDLSNAAWAKSAVTIGVDTALAPNGTLTADTIVATTSTGQHDVNFLFQPFSGISYTLSCYFKKGTTRYVYINSATTGVLGLVVFDFDNETFTQQTNYVGSFSNVGNGWYRVSATLTSSTSSSVRFRFGITLSATSESSSLTTSDNAFIWGAQLVEGTDAKPYFPTTNRLDVPRLDYRNADGTVNSCPRLLLEPQRTNSIRNSTMVGAVAGSPGTVPTNWGNVGASGGLSRDVVGVGISNGLPYVDLRYYGTASSAVIIMAPDSFFSNTTSAGQVWTTSFWLSYIGSGRPNRTDIAIDWRGGSPAVIISTISPTSSLARFSFSGTATTGTTTAMGYVQFILTIGATYDFTIRIAAPQMELGAYATTFIPTTTAAVTRLVDAFSRNNLFTNNIVTASGGTWFLDLSGNLSIPRDTSTGIFIGDSATNNTGNQIIIRNGSSSGSARVSILKYISGTVTSIYTTTSDNLKLAIKWNGSVVEVFQNGVKVVSSSVFTTTNMQNLVGNGGGTPFFINQSSLFPTPLTDEECITITTL